MSREELLALYNAAAPPKWWQPRRKRPRRLEPWKRGSDARV